MTLFYTSQQQQQQQNHNIHSGNLNNITQRTSPTTTTSIATSESTLNMSSAAAGEATSVTAATTVTTSTTTNLVAASTTPTTTDLPDIIAPFPKKFLYAYAGHLLNNGNFISTQVAPTATNANNTNDQSLLTTSSLLQLQLQHQQQHQQLQQQLQQQKLQLQQIQQKMTSPTTTTTAPTTDVTNDSPWGLSAVQEDSEDDNLNNNINNNGDTLESMSDEALACAELMEIMGNSSRGSSRPVSLSGSPDRFSNSIINSSNISNINKKFIIKSTTKSMEELKISDNKNNITNDFYDDNDRNENIVTANVSNSYDELKAIEIEKMRQRPFTISTSTLNASSSSSASGSTTTSPTTIRPGRLAVDNSHLLFGSSPITRAHNPLPMDSYFSPTKQRSKQFPHNHNQQQLLRPTSLYQANHYYYDNNNKNDSGIEGETNFFDGDINNENAASDITKVGGISRMINNLNDNSFENVSKIPHNLSKASKTAIFMSISEGGRRRSLSVGSAGLKTGSKIIGC